MSNLIPESDIQEIISNFNDDINEYEIVNIDNHQGWGSTHLYLIVALNETPRPYGRGIFYSSSFSCAVACPMSSCS